jgi:hypothetical protein
VLGLANLIQMLLAVRVGVRVTVSEEDFIILVLKRSSEA